MKTRIECKYSAGLLDVIEEDNHVFQGSVATTEFHLFMDNEDKSQDWLPTDGVFICLTRSDGKTSGALKMNLDQEGGWIYISNGWLEDVDLGREEGTYKVSFLMRRYSTLDGKTLISTKTSEEKTLPISPSVGWVPQDIDLSVYEQVIQAISNQDEKIDELVKDQNKVIDKLENFQIGTVTAKASGSGAQPQVTAEIINQSTPNRYLLDLDFTLPRGEQGEQGMVGQTGRQGPRGEQGETGETALMYYGPAIQFTTNPDYVNITLPLASYYWSRTPVVGDGVIVLGVYDDEGYVCNSRVIEVGTDTCRIQTIGYVVTGVIGSNPNLLINPDSAINQRGITTLLQGTGYMSDRWYKMAGSNSNKIDIENGTYTMTITATLPSWNISRTLTQAIECSESLWGKQVTFSVNVIEPAQNNDFSIFVYALDAQKGIIDQTHSFVYLNSTGLKYVTFTVPQDTVYLQVAIDVNLKNGTIGNFVKFNEPKLEIGTVATPFSPPNIAEELPKCQRYYIDTCYQIKSDLAPYALGSGLCYSASFAYFVVPISTSMRVSAAQVTSKNNIDSLVVLADGQTLPITAITVIGSNNTSITVRVTGTFEIGSAAVLRVKSGENALGILAFDAEI